MPSKAKKGNASQPAASRLPQTNPPKQLPQLPTALKATDGNAQTPSRPSSGAGTENKPDDEATSITAGQAVNRKKQKRREKEAAKRATEQSLDDEYQGMAPAANGQLPLLDPTRLPSKGYFTEEPDYANGDFLVDDGEEYDQEFYSGDEDQLYSPDLGTNSQPWGAGHASKKKRKKKGQKTDSHDTNSLARLPSSRSHLHPPALSAAAIRSAHRMTGESIWNTSTLAERENIKQFWLELREEERRSLVRVEKEAVLRKMKEQQKHSCSCSVCGRKRTAIEEELEVLYDAYYEELETFANHNDDRSEGELNDEEEYDDEDDGYSEDDLDGLPPRPPEFFRFGDSLTVKEGILTVADDLLKNDGKKFIDMMEQLAERRMQREEEIHYPSTALAHPNVHQGHNHPPLDEEEDDYDDEDDEDYDSQEEDEYEDDSMDSMTEEQRMEEGRRMFQIFAARMFEQRVLTAYREKVAQERQQKLLEELDEENRLDTQREVKKAKEAAKKKEKKRQQKLAKDEEKTRREAEKAAQEKAVKDAEERKAEEQRQRKEEQRKKREAERKAAEEERLKKEAEKQRRAQEERERQADMERKQKDARDREKKKRDDTKRKEREEREAKDKESRDRKAKEDQERKEKEDQTRKEKEAALRADKDARDRQTREQAARRYPVALPPGLHPPQHPSQMQSPSFPVATPIMPPKVPTPTLRNRQSSQPSQQSHTSSPRSQPANLNASRSSVSPPVTLPQTPSMQPLLTTVQGQPLTLHHPQPSAPLSPLSSQGRNSQPHFNMNGMSTFGMNAPQVSGPPMMPPIGPPPHMYGGQGINHGRFGPAQNLQYPPGFSVPRIPPGQQLPSQSGPIYPSNSGPVGAVKPPSHSRQPSEPFHDQSGQPAPIARPGPIGRPPSTTPDKQKPKSKPKTQEAEVDQLATQLGSKALLDDSDVPFSADSDVKVNLPAIGAPRLGPPTLGSAFGDSKHDTFGMGGPTWNGFSPSMSSNSSWGAPSPATRAGVGWTQPSTGAFGAIGGGLPSMPRSHGSRPVMIRTLLVQACRQLSTPGSDGFAPAQNVLRHVEALKGPSEPSITMDEMLAICDTEGNAQNGGGYFEVRNDPGRGQLVKFEPDAGFSGTSAPGDIGSPVAHYSLAAPGFGGTGPGFGPPGRSF